MPRTIINWSVPEQIVFNGDTRIRGMADGSVRGQTNTAPVFESGKKVVGWITLSLVIVPEADENKSTIHMALITQRAIATTRNPIKVDLDLSSVSGESIHHWHGLQVMWDAYKVLEVSRSQMVSRAVDAVRHARISVDEAATWHF